MSSVYRSGNNIHAGGELDNFTMIDDDLDVTFTYIFDHSIATEVEKEVIKEVEVPVEVIKEVEKEVPVEVEKIIEKETIKEVPVEKVGSVIFVVLKLGEPIMRQLESIARRS